MAHIKTPDHRPQMATVRYKIMNAPERSEEESGEIVNCSIAKERLGSHVDVLDIENPPYERYIYLAKLKEKYLAPVVNEFIEYVKESNGKAL